MAKKILKILIRRIPRKWQIPASLLLARLLYPFYRGDKMHCPVCDKNFKKFLPYGIGDNYRANALCPYCFSLERHRLIWLYWQKETALFSAPLKVLHLAPEQCFYFKFKKLPNLDYVSADLDSPLAMVKADICRLPFVDADFDVVICSHVLEHVEDDSQALREIRRVLKPDGWGLIQVPLAAGVPHTREDPSITDKRLREKLYGRPDHCRQYGLDFGQTLAKAGFKARKIDYLPGIGPAYAGRAGLSFKLLHIFYIIRK